VLCSLSTEFDPTLKSPGSLESSVLAPLVAGGLLGLPVRQRIAHWLTASSNSGFPGWPPRRLVSCRPALVIDLRLFRPSGVFGELPAGCSGESVSVRLSWYGRIYVGQVESVPAGS